MDKLKRALAWFNGSNSAEAKCVRTIFQGIIGVLIALVTAYNGAEPVFSLVLCPLCMAVLAPIQAYLGGNYNEGK
ncbi:MAG: hypothetical protein IKE20_04325 [Eggerthellaceae bacterium]|nr:hypothetical protein [Eggerthellaceae bacterium]